MKQKIKSALEQEYKQRLGVGEEAFERVAAFGQTFITSDEQIATFVKGAEEILKAEQSAADRVRTELNAKIKGLEGDKADLEAKLKGNQTPPASTAALSAEAFAEAIAKQMGEIVNPLKAELEQLRAEKTAEQSIATAKSVFFANEWANGYPELRDRAWAQTMRIYEKLGGKMTAEELQSEAMENFKPLAQTQGLDVEKPFEGNKGSTANSETLVSEMVEVLKASGRIKETKV